MKNLLLPITLLAIAIASCTKTTTVYVTQPTKDSVMIIRTYTVVPVQPDTPITRTLLAHAEDTVYFDKPQNIYYNDGTGTGHRIYLWLFDKGAVTGTEVNVYFHLEPETQVWVLSRQNGFALPLHDPTVNPNSRVQYYKIKFMGYFNGTDGTSAIFNVEFHTW